MSSAPVSPSALLAGLCTLDIIQAVDRVPGPNEKITALDQTVAAGGPAANAAVTFAFLGGHATLLTGAGRHPLAEGIRADLARAGVRLIDAAETDVRFPRRPHACHRRSRDPGRRRVHLGAAVRRRGSGAVLPELRHPRLDGLTRRGCLRLG